MVFLELITRLHLRVRETARVALQRRRVRIVDAAGHVDQHHLVLWPWNVLVKERGRQDHFSKGRPALWLFVRPEEPNRRRLPGRELDSQRRAEVEVVLLRIIAVGEEPALPESCRDRIVAELPVEPDDLRDVRVNGADVVRGAEELRRAGANRRLDDDAGLAFQRPARPCRDRSERTGRGNRVVADEELVDRVLERRA